MCTECNRVGRRLKVHLFLFKLILLMNQMFGKSLSNLVEKSNAVEGAATVKLYAFMLPT